MTTSRRVLLGAAAGILAAGLTAPLAAQHMPELSVRVDWTPWGMHAGFHLAKEKGWFEEAGVDVEVSDGKGSSLTLQQVAAGDIDVGWVQLGTMATARGQGLPLISIAGLVRKGELGALVERGAGLETVKDLEGHKVAYTATSGWGPLVEVFLEAGGADRSRVELVNVDASSLVSAFTSGSVDASLTTYAFFKPIVEEARPADGILLADVGINIPSYGLVTTPAVLEEKADALERFVPVVIRAWEYIHDGHIDEAVEAIMSQRPHEKLDPDILRGQIEEYQPFFNTEATADEPYGWQAEEDWAATIEVLESVGVIEPGSQPADYYTNRFVPRA